MQANTALPTTNPALASGLIKKWKSDPALRDQYANDAGAFFIHAEWDQDENLRDEFNNDFESYAAFSRRTG